ncbi:LAFE_0E00628g1_1 [Lachancea fermentati]|uniref:Kinesin-like protein n=1 Tax=Lachancea fermentati TaxID=4955 RepID=A0A1G4MCQ0_LACFM|nr:LAFE_0E00628g1_1 [Lachancea fermentati]
MSDEEELNITVAIRCRGRNEKEIKAKSSVVVSVPDVMGSNEVSLNTTGDVGIAAQMNSKTYTVDKVFGPSADQQLIFKEIAEPLFHDFMKGYNCTVLVYGMTSTGKTYTMTGDERLYDGELSEAAGVIPRVLFKLFEELTKEDADHMVKCSFVELYNEELRDLLDEPQETTLLKKLRIFDSNSNLGSSRAGSRSNSPRSFDGSTSLKRKSKQQPLQKQVKHILQKSQQPADQNSAIYIQNLQEFHIMSAREGIGLLQRGLRHRQVASTKMNDVSSRSHTIFTIMLYKKCDGEAFRVSKMNLVDLAGSENINRSGAQNQRAKEAGSINQSLLTLGRVINSLADKSSHIPFRESKLTRLLQDSLGGNTKTALIATISPAKINSEETSSTLEYATKAKNIKNKPQLGSFVMKDVLVKNVTAELIKIKSDLLSTKSKDGIYMSQEHYRELTNDLENYKTEVQECKRELEKLASQNSLLLKDKKTSNELHELQRLKISKLGKSIEILYDKIDRQHKNEQELVNAVQRLMHAINIMQQSLRVYKDNGQKFQNEMEKVLRLKMDSFKNSLRNEIVQVKQNLTEESTNIDPNIENIVNELDVILESVQTSSIEICQKFIDGVLDQTPDHFETISKEVKNVSTIVNSYSVKLMSHLSSISEEYNHLKEYLNDHFFKNNFQEALDVHVDRTYHQLKITANGLIAKLQESMNDQLDENRNNMMKNLKNAASGVVTREMGLLEPVKKTWEASLENINQCDKLNHEFENDINTAVNGLHNDINNALKTTNIAVADVKKGMKKFEGISGNLRNNEALSSNIQEMRKKHVWLKDQIKQHTEYMNTAKFKLEEIDHSMKDILNIQSLSPKAENDDSVDLLLQQLKQKQLKPVGSTGKTPMRTSSWYNSGLNCREDAEDRSNKASPIKTSRSNSMAASPLKRTRQEDDHHVSKSPKIS